MLARPPDEHQQPLNSAALTAAVFAALSIVFLPLAWFLGAWAAFAARRARREVSRTGQRGETLASLSLCAGWATIGIVTAIYAAVLLSAAFQPANKWS